MKLLAVRDKIWDYPYFLFIGRNSVFGRINELYTSTRPFSIVATTIVIATIIGALLISQVAVVLGFNRQEFIEGVIVGRDASGELLGPGRLNPLEVFKPQLDQDIIEIIYEPLIRVGQDGKVEPILAEQFSFDEESKNPSYRFSLRKDISWHDGTKFTTQDVKATFELIKELSSTGSENIFASEAALNVDLEVLDDYVCIFRVNGQTLPNFYELITFKIVPSHLINEFREALVKSTGIEKLSAVGTGPFKLSSISRNEVLLLANKDYYRGVPKLERFKFRLLTDDDEAIAAVKSGQIHGLANLNSDILKEIRDVSNAEILSSNVIYNQYFGIYFNLSENGRGELKDIKIRQAMSYAINRRLAIETIFETAEPAYGPVPPNNEYYAKDVSYPTYDANKSKSILDAAGWQLSVDDQTGKQIRTKENAQLKFTIDYVVNPDRQKIIESVIADLEQIGIIVTPKPLTSEEFNASRNSDNVELTMLGVNTFIDADRYEFFHSSQTRDSESGSGLNFSAYKSVRSTVAIDEQEKKTIRIPLVDKLLDTGRKTTNTEERRQSYHEFQEVIADEVPVIFLYYPTLRYSVNRRVKNVSLNNIKAYVERFNSVHEWEIVY